MSNIVVHTSSLVAQAGSPPAMAPAAATAMSSPPKCLVVAMTAASTADWSRTSAMMPMARSSAAPQASATASSSAGVAKE